MLVVVEMVLSFSKTWARVRIGEVASRHRTVRGKEGSNRIEFNLMLASKLQCLILFF